MDRVLWQILKIMKTLKHIIAFASLLAVLSTSAYAQTSLASLSGGNVDVQAQNGKVVVLAVGASWLPLSGKQAEVTNALKNKYKSGVTIYFVATDSNNPKSKNHATDDELRQWAAKNNLSVTILRDPDGASVMKKFRVDQLPAFVVLDKNGNLSGDPVGGIDPKADGTAPIARKVDPLL